MANRRKTRAESSRRCEWIRYNTGIRKNKKINAISYCKSTLTGRDRTDLAVLKIKANDGKSWRYIKPCGIPIYRRTQLYASVIAIKGFDSDYVKYL